MCCIVFPPKKILAKLETTSIPHQGMSSWKCRKIMEYTLSRILNTVLKLHQKFWDTVTKKGPFCTHCFYILNGRKWSKFSILLGNPVVLEDLVVQHLQFFPVLRPSQARHRILYHPFDPSSLVNQVLLVSPCLPVTNSLFKVNKKFPGIFPDLSWFCTSVLYNRKNWSNSILIIEIDRQSNRQRR